MTQFNDVPKEFIVGRKYHCSWATKRGYVWRLISYDEIKNTAILETPKTHKRLNTQLSSLREINKNVHHDTVQ